MNKILIFLLVSLSYSQILPYIGNNTGVLAVGSGSHPLAFGSGTSVSKVNLYNKGAGVYFGEPEENTQMGFLYAYKNWDFTTEQSLALGAEFTLFQLDSLYRATIYKPFINYEWSQIHWGVGAQFSHQNFANHSSFTQSQYFAGVHRIWNFTEKNVQHQLILGAHSRIDTVLAPSFSVSWLYQDFYQSHLELRKNEIGSWQNGFAQSFKFNPYLQVEMAVASNPFLWGLQFSVFFGNSLKSGVGMYSSPDLPLFKSVGLEWNEKAIDRMPARNLLD